MLTLTVAEVLVAMPIRKVIPTSPYVGGYFITWFDDVTTWAAADNLREDLYTRTNLVKGITFHSHVNGETGHMLESI